MTARDIVMSAAGGTADKTYIEDVFSTYLYTGNGSTQTIDNGIDLAGKGGLVWCKERGAAASHALFDTVRGAYAILSTDSTDVSSSISPSGVTAFNSGGFSIGDNSSGGFGVNGSSKTYTSWTFRKAPKFFDVVTYTGDGTDNRLISHSLSQTPGMVVVKCTSTSASWCVWHRNLGGSNYNMYLNTTGSNGAQGDFSSNGSAAFSSTSFPVSNGGLANTSGETYVAYLFAHDTTTDGLIQCGSFTTDSSGNATVDLGWEPQYILYKRTDSTGNWHILDNMRGYSTSTSDPYLYPNLPDAEYVYSTKFDTPTATGFKVTNYSATGTYIYMAIRRGPMRTPTDGTEVFQPIAYTGNATANTLRTAGFPVDLVWGLNRDGNTNRGCYDRLRGAATRLLLNTTAAEAAETTNLIGVLGFDSNVGYLAGQDQGQGTVNFSAWTYANALFRRAPGFFDVVCWTGNDSSQVINHSLGVVPELVIVKRRNDVRRWKVYYGNPTYELALDSVTSYASDFGTMTATTFQMIADNPVNTHVAYLFASCPGVSKVGSYTGNGSSQTINCGFAAGARFVLIKRTDSTGDWYVWDTARGIVSANDPHLSLNTIDAEVTTNDTIDPASSGFIVNQVTATNVNVTDATYIYLAIA